MRFSLPLPVQTTLFWLLLSTAFTAPVLAAPADLPVNDQTKAAYETAAQAEAKNAEDTRFLQPFLPGSTPNVPATQTPLETPADSPAAPAPDAAPADVDSGNTNDESNDSSTDDSNDDSPSGN